MRQLKQLYYGALLLFFAACIWACEQDGQVMIAFRSFKYAEALLELTDPGKRRSHSEVPVLLLGTFKEIEDAASESILETIKETKEGKDDRSVDVGLVLTKRWIKKQERHPDWALIVRNIRKEFKKLAGFSLRAVIIEEGGKVPIELAHAIESANLALLKSSETKTIKFQSVRRKSGQRKLMKKLKKAIKKHSIIEIKFKSHPQSAHFKVIRKAFKKAKRELVDVSACFLVRP